MPCLACGRPGWPLCGGCRSALRPAPTRALGAGLVGRAAWSHGGTGRVLVSRLKYQGLVAVAEVAAAALGPVPSGVSCIVPVPRVLARRVLHGIDPARVFADALSRRWGLEVVEALVAPVWSPRRAGRGHRPAPPGLVAVAPVRGALVVDDVITTGATVAAAARLVGSTSAAAVTMTKYAATPTDLRTMGRR